MNEENLIYQSQKVPEFFVRSASEEDDPQLVKLISETMPSNGMTLAFERNPSYLKASSAQYNCPDIKVIAPNRQPDLVVGMMNLGWKKYYINQKSCELRYVADLRILPEYRGKKVLRLLMDYVYEVLPQNTIFQSIVLEDNLAARHILHDPRMGFPTAYHYDDICTFTVSNVKQSQAYAKYQFRVLDESLIAQANAFLHEMKAYYNFLPHYDFSELLIDQHPFWLGLKLSDFYLIYDQNQLVGLYGLWDQKKFKQTRVLDYSKSLRWVKPFYNTYAKLTSSLRLPEKNQTFEYLMLHSVLCHPCHGEVFDSMMYHAKVQTKQRNKQAFCITLAKQDSRIQQMKKTRAHIMCAKHSFHSFSSNPFDVFDRTNISYFEVGRI